MKIGIAEIIVICVIALVAYRTGEASDLREKAGGVAERSQESDRRSVQGHPREYR